MHLISPAFYYLKYLVSHPDGFSNDAIKERCSVERVDYVSDAYLDKLRGSLKIPVPFYPTDKRHKKSLKFLLEEGIHRLFLTDTHMRMAHAVLSKPRAKEFIETNILLRVPLSPIAAFVSQHCGLSCTAAALQVYQHYFWNIDLLDSTEMRVLLAMRIEQTADTVPEFKDKKKLLQAAYYRDPRKIAADLPSSPMAVMLAQMYLGIRPGKADLTMRMMETRDLALIRAGEAVMQSSLNDSVRFLNYANGSRILEEMLQLTSKPEDHMQDQLRAIALRTDTHDVPYIHQLSSGRHTVEMAPLKDTNESDEAFVANGSHGSGDGGTER